MPFLPKINYSIEIHEAKLGLLHWATHSVARHHLKYSNWVRIWFIYY